MKAGEGRGPGQRPGGEAVGRGGAPFLGKTISDTVGYTSPRRMRRLSGSVFKVNLDARDRKARREGGLLKVDHRARPYAAVSWRTHCEDEAPNQTGLFQTR